MSSENSPQNTASSPMLRCAVLDDYQGAAMRYGNWEPLLQCIELKVFNEHVTSEDDLASALATFDIIVLMRERTRMTPSLLARLTKLRLIVTTGSRNGSIDLAACEQAGVLVCGTRGAGHATAELTWALILGFERHLMEEANNLRSAGQWQSFEGREVAGKCLGIIGLGKLGARVATIGKAFGMNVIAWSRNLDDARCAEVGVRRAPTLEDLLKASDVISIHMVLSERTRGLIGEAAFNVMKPDALLVNTSRAPIVDEPALLRALTARRIKGAALDVFEQEPLPADHPFRTLQNVLATPHIGYVTEETYRIFYTDVVEDIAAWLAGSPVRIVDEQHPAQALVQMGTSGAA